MKIAIDIAYIGSTYRKSTRWGRQGTIRAESFCIYFFPSVSERTLYLFLHNILCTERERGVCEFGT